MRLAHPFANAVRHEPCCPIGAEAELPPELMRAHTLFAGAEQVRGEKPFVQRDMGALVDGTRWLP